MGLLNVDDPTDIFILHFVFIPLINYHLHCFAEGWSNHTMRTEHNRTPLQLWISGMMARQCESGQQDFLLAEVKTMDQDILYFIVMHLQITDL